MGRFQRRSGVGLSSSSGEYDFAGLGSHVRVAIREDYLTLSAGPISSTFASHFFENWALVKRHLCVEIPFD
jgi:hypothetical protein